MLIWLGVVGTVLALAVLVLIAVVWNWVRHQDRTIELLQRCESALGESEIQFAKETGAEWRQYVEVQKSVAAAAEVSNKANADRLESALRDLQQGVKVMANAWGELAQEIHNRYQNYEKATKLAERQVAAIEYLQKVMKSMQGLAAGRRPVSDNLQVPSDDDAAEVERMTELEKSMFVRSAAGLDGGGDEGL